MSYSSDVSMVYTFQSSHTIFQEGLLSYEQFSLDLWSLHSAADNAGLFAICVLKSHSVFHGLCWSLENERRVTHVSIQ